MLNNEGSSICFQTTWLSTLTDSIIHMISYDYFQRVLFEASKDEKHCKRHGAVLCLSAIINAFPFTIPQIVIGMIPEYCQLGNIRDSVIRVCTVFTVSQTFSSVYAGLLQQKISRMGVLSAKMMPPDARFFYETEKFELRRSAKFLLLKFNLCWSLSAKYKNFRRLSLRLYDHFFTRIMISF